MNNDKLTVKYFKQVAEDQYAVMLLTDYGVASIQKLTFLTDSISEIYEYLQYSSFDTVRIFTSITQGLKLSSNINIVTVNYMSFENLAQISGKDIVIELEESGEIIIALDQNVDINIHRANSIIYEFNLKESVELFYGKNDIKILRSIPYCDSYFATQSYKELNLAFEDYRSKFARNSSCPVMEDIWFDDKRIFFKRKPEHTLRDSLTYFLKARLRGVEVRPEQIVDKSHPVDIKLTWTSSGKIALIEIKWLGKSLEAYGKNFSQVYNRQRALEGAEQLASYLDENKVQAPNKNTVGYLVVYDARRYNSSNTTRNIDLKNGLHYQNDEIRYEPDYSSIRTDFAKPVRFFLEPICN